MLAPSFAFDSHIIDDVDALLGLNLSVAEINERLS
jgi:hypothetical protein